MPTLRKLMPAAALVAALIAPSSAPAVVGGQDASRPYPHMAELRDGGDFICGASLVAANKILTASHCVDGAKAENLSFVIGRTTRSDTSSGEEIRASSVRMHPGYDPDTMANDVAVVTLARNATMGTPIALADPVADRSLWEVGDYNTVTGWGARVGYDVLGVTVTDRLQEVRVPIVDDQECDDNYVLMGGVHETSVCAGELYGTKDSCQGDSGGPLVAQDATGALKQTGVVSWGFGCGYPTQYGVYARIGDDPLNSWIRQQVGGTTTTTTSSPTTKTRGKKS